MFMSVPLGEIQQRWVVERLIGCKVGLAEQRILIDAQRVVRQKMNIAHAGKLPGGKIGNRFNRRFVGVKALNQRDAQGYLFPGGGQALEIIEHAFGRPIGPLFKARVIHVL